MTGRVRRLLVAYDAGGPAEVALELGIELSVATGAALGIVTVVPEPTEPPDDPWSETSERAAELHLAKLRAAEAGLSAETHLARGVAGREIVNLARTFGYDTVVIGSRGLGPIKRRLLGSVSRYVATHSAATTIIAR